jgi:hypothetical protein
MWWVSARRAGADIPRIGESAFQAGTFYRTSMRLPGSYLVALSLELGFRGVGTLLFLAAAVTLRFSDVFPARRSGMHV